MACDIHLHVEVKRDDGQWNEVKPDFPCHSCEGTGRGRDARDRNCWWCDGTGKETTFFSTRNYSLFSILAGVRQRDNVEPIDSPRGLPADVSCAVKADCEHWDCDGHSHSWLTLAELQAYDWEAAKASSILSFYDEFINETIPRLAELGSPDNVRIVFWFDN